MNLRNQAEMRPCMVRLPEVCTGNDAQTVLAHARLAGITGAGMKAPDALGAWACMGCHDEIDGRTRRLERDFVRLAFYEGILRTQYALIQEGKIRW